MISVFAPLVLNFGTDSSSKNAPKPRDPALGAWKLGLKKAFIEKLRYLQSNSGGETDFDNPDKAHIELPPQKKTRLESRLTPNASL